jgi:hypothetical protein
VEVLEAVAYAGGWTGVNGSETMIIKDNVASPSLQWNSLVGVI